MAAENSPATRRLIKNIFSILATGCARYKETMTNTFKDDTNDNEEQHNYHKSSKAWTSKAQLRDIWCTTVGVVGTVVH